MFNVIEKNRISDQIIEEIKKRILSGDIKAGDKLPSERSLSKSFNVTRIPIREALKALEKMGFIKIEPGEGSVVNDIFSAPKIEVLPHLFNNFSIISFDIISSVMEFRVLVGSELTVKGIKNITDEQIVELKTIVKEEKQVDDIKILQEKDLEFFRVIAEASGNLIYKFLLNFVGDFYLKNGDLLEALIVSKDYMVKTHEKLIKCSLAKDDILAYETAKNYFVKGFEKLLGGNNE